MSHPSIRLPQHRARLNHSHWLYNDIKFLWCSTTQGIQPIVHREEAKLAGRDNCCIQMIVDTLSLRMGRLGPTLPKFGVAAYWQWEDAGTNPSYVSHPANSDLTLLILVDKVTPAAAGNPLFMRYSAGGDTFFGQNGVAANRPWIRIAGVDILQASSGPAWTTGQLLDFMVCFKNAAQVDVYWDGAQQHTAVHSTSIGDGSGNLGMRNWGANVSSSIEESGEYYLIMLLHRYLERFEAEYLLRNLAELFSPVGAPRRYFVGSAPDPAVVRLMHSGLVW